MTTETTELLPCRKCGNPPTIVDVKGDIGSYYKIFCTDEKCCCEHEKAASIWNASQMQQPLKLPLGSENVRYGELPQSLLDIAGQQKQPRHDNFDYQRVKKWALDKSRKRANMAFTAGIERQVAYLIEDIQQPRKWKMEELLKMTGFDEPNWHQYYRTAARVAIEKLAKAGVFEIENGEG